MRSLYRITVLLLFGLVPLILQGNESPQSDNEIIEKLKAFSASISPQKVYLHIDKSDYTAGETIWFKSYLFEGITHNLLADSVNIFVDLVNSEGEIIEVRVMLSENGMADGDIRLATNLPDGNYIIRAYTDWMKNFGVDHFYNNYIYIQNNNYADYIPRSDLRNNRRFNRTLGRLHNNYNVAFFPEGGNLVAGVPNRVAFKAYDGVGRGLFSVGELVDRGGNVITTIETEYGGIGVFEFTPEPGVRYNARISVAGERTASYNLPGIENDGYILRADYEGDSIYIKIYSTVKEGSSLYSENLIIVGHSRGNPAFGKVFPSGQESSFAVDAGLFPTGIVSFSLFAGDHQPIAERLIFIDHNDNIKISNDLREAEVNGDDFTHLRINVTDMKGNPVSGNFSLSAVTGDQIEGAWSDDILSYLLMSSDLDGLIKLPDAFFNSGQDYDKAIDFLLLTHGWRRFEWRDVIAGNLPDIRYPSSPGLTISGRIFDPAKNEPVSNHPVELHVMSGHDHHYETLTGRNGSFTFDTLFYNGIVNIELSSMRLSGNYPPIFELQTKSTEVSDYLPGVYTREQEITSLGDRWIRPPRVAPETNYSDATDRNVTDQIYGVPDQTIFIDHSVSAERSILDVLRNRASGIRIINGEIVIRQGQLSFDRSNEPTFMLDGIDISRQMFLDMSPREIERIELFRGTSASVFGLKGGSGVIIAYSRRPGYQGFEDVIELSLLGYHEPREFYTDRVDIMKSIQSEQKPLKTVYWSPNLVANENGVIDLYLPYLENLGPVKVTIEGAGQKGEAGFGQFTINTDR